MDVQASQCPHCGQTNPPGTSFCGHCGRAFAAAEPRAGASAAQPPKPAGRLGRNLLLAGALVASACLACSVFGVWFSTTPASKSAQATSEARRTATAQAVGQRGGRPSDPANTPAPADTLRPPVTPSRTPKPRPQVTSTSGPSAMPAEPVEVSATPPPAATPEPTATPAPTATPTAEPTAPPFSEIRDTHDRMTEAQWNEYTRSLDGLPVRWTGWVDEVSEGWLGGYDLRVDLNRDGLYDVSMPISKEDALRLMKGQQVTFTGYIDSVGALFWVTVTLRDAVVEP